MAKKETKEVEVKVEEKKVKKQTKTVTEAVNSKTIEDYYKIIKSQVPRAIYGESLKFCNINKIRTGIPTIDYLTSGGISEGRITLFAGNPSSGKSTTTYQIIAKIQEHYAASGIIKFIVIVDSEDSFEEKYARRLGVNMDFVILIRERIFEDVLRQVSGLVETGIVGAVVIDSLDNLVQGKQENSDYGNTMGSEAGAISMHFPTFNKVTSAHNVTIVLIKQARVKMDTYGSKAEVITFSGGKALRHMCSSIFIMKRLSNRDLGYVPIQVKAEKTRSVRMGLIQDIPLKKFGVDITRDLLNLGLMFNIVSSGGGGWTTFETLKAQGAENFLKELKQNPEILKRLEKLVYEKIDEDEDEGIIGKNCTIGENFEVISDDSVTTEEEIKEELNKELQEEKENEDNQDNKKD